MYVMVAEVSVWYEDRSCLFRKLHPAKIQRIGEQISFPLFHSFFLLVLLLIVVKMSFFVFQVKLFFVIQFSKCFNDKKMHKK